jgi:hypothetical protein
VPRSTTPRAPPIPQPAPLPASVRRQRAHPRRRPAAGPPGYGSVAPELFHRTAPGFEGDHADFSSPRPHTQALTPATLEADVRATLAGERRAAGEAYVNVEFAMADPGFVDDARPSFNAAAAVQA